MTKFSWRCYQYGEPPRTVHYYACTFLPTASTTGTTIAAAAAITVATTNKSTVTTVLHKWKSNGDDEDFDETNSKPHLSFPFVASYPFSGDKSLQVKVINCSK